MNNLTEIERLVIERAAMADRGICLQAPTIEVQSRKHTGVGLYTYFSSAAHIAEKAERKGPAYQYRVFSEALPHGGGVILWVSDSGAIDCLEFYAHIDQFPTTEFQATIE